MRGEGKGVLGFVPDMSIFQNHPHEPWIQEALNEGCRKEVLDAMLEKHATQRPREEILAGDLSKIEQFYGAQLIEDYDGATQVEQLRELMDCVFYMHGKFYYINDNLEEIAIPYQEILTMVKDSGYEATSPASTRAITSTPRSARWISWTATWPCATIFWANKAEQI